ncbi:MAG: 4-(cytidine 5'-diphospho)-2-C-methyl-D-erythritol kinase [Chloroflexota bacterium]
MQARAYAKINLTLEVLGKRPDGYHELVSLVQTISLADELELHPGDGLTLECDWPDLADDSNLVLRAARLLSRGGRFVLRKRIPVAAGLGGGSSDGAAALRLLNAAYQLDLPESELLAAAADLGSDVPFFLYGGTALVEGRGERVTPLPDQPEQWLVLLNPGLPLSTAAVFRELLPEECAAVSVTASWVGQNPAGMPMVNTLEAPAERLEPAISAFRQKLLDAGASEAHISGSGATLFALAADEHSAAAIAAACDGVVAYFIPRQEALRIQPDRPT